MKPSLLALATALALLASSLAHAWGPTGHRVIGELAARELTPAARKAVRGLLGEVSLAQASTWGDEIRSHPDQARFKKFEPWHYFTLPPGEDLSTVARPAEGDVLSAMEANVTTLADRKAALPAREEALRLLLHFVGDVHQPLHVGNGRDRGGNDFAVTFFKEPTNLHRVWDSQLIDHRGLSFTEHARFILEAAPVARRPPGPRRLGAAPGEALRAWIRESAAIREREGVYPPREGEAPPALGYDYVFQAQPIVDRRLREAGERLGALLNDLLDPAQGATKTEGATKKRPAARRNPKDSR